MERRMLIYEGLWLRWIVIYFNVLESTWTDKLIPKLLLTEQLPELRLLHMPV